MEPIEIRSARGTNIAMAALMFSTGGPVFALGVHRWLSERPELASKLMAPVGLFLMVAGLLALRNAWQRPVQVRLSEAGVYDRRYGRATIPWAEIAEIEVMRKRGRLDLRVELLPEGRGRMMMDLVPLEDGLEQIRRGVERYAPQVPLINLLPPQA